jgi:hypothetical protein
MSFSYHRLSTFQLDTVDGVWLIPDPRPRGSCASAAFVCSFDFSPREESEFTLLYDHSRVSMKVSSPTESIPGSFRMNPRIHQINVVKPKTPNASCRLLFLSDLSLCQYLAKSTRHTLIRLCEEIRRTNKAVNCLSIEVDQVLREMMNEKCLGKNNCIVMSWLLCQTGGGKIQRRKIIRGKRGGGQIRGVRQEMA